MARTIKQRLRPLLDFIRYAGNARTCPICGKSARRFLPYGTIQRPDARCPFCDSIERHRFFWLYLQRRTDLLTNPPKKALHIAPEQSLERKLRPLFGDGYLTADLLEPNVDMKMDIMDIPFPDGTFDFIYCSHVLEHVPDDRKAMREFYRLLTPNGIAVLPVPIAVEVTDEDPSITDPKERLRRFLQEDHVRIYGKDYPDRLREEGFDVEVIERKDVLQPGEAEKMSIGEIAGEIYIGRRKPE